MICKTILLLGLSSISLVYGMDVAKVKLSLQLIEKTNGTWEANKKKSPDEKQKKVIRNNYIAAVEGLLPTACLVYQELLSPDSQCSDMHELSTLLDVTNEKPEIAKNLFDCCHDAFNKVGEVQASIYPEGQSYDHGSMVSRSKNLFKEFGRLNLLYKQYVDGPFVNDQASNSSTSSTPLAAAAPSPSASASSVVASSSSYGSATYSVAVSLSRSSSSAKVSASASSISSPISSTSLGTSSSSTRVNHSFLHKLLGMLFPRH